MRRTKKTSPIEKPKRVGETARQVDEKPRDPMSSWDAYITEIKKVIGRALTETEYSLLMQQYIRAVSVIEAVEKLS
jgi:hypothetical protein